MIEITNANQLEKLLKALTTEGKALFGKMTPQHMVEYLTDLVQYSYNHPPHKLYYSIEKANTIKAVAIYSEKKLKLGFISPALGKI